MSYDPPPPQGGPSGRPPRPGPQPPQAPGEQVPPGARPPTPPGGFDRPRPAPRHLDRPPTPPGGVPRPATPPAGFPPPGGVERPGGPPRPAGAPPFRGEAVDRFGEPAGGVAGGRPATPPGGFDRPGPAGGAPERPATPPRGFGRPGDLVTGEPGPGAGRPFDADPPPGRRAPREDADPSHRGAFEDPTPGRRAFEDQPGRRAFEDPAAGRRAFEDAEPGGRRRAPEAPEPTGRRRAPEDPEPVGRRRAPEPPHAPVSTPQVPAGARAEHNPRTDLGARLGGSPPGGRRPRPAPDPDATRYTAPVQPNADTTYTNAFSGSLQPAPGAHPRAPHPQPPAPPAHHAPAPHPQAPHPQAPHPQALRPGAPRPPHRPRPADPPTEVIPAVEDDLHDHDDRYEDDEYYDEDDAYEHEGRDRDDDEHEDDRPALLPDTPGRKAVRAFGETLITLGLVILLFVVYEVYVTDLISAGKQDDATQALDDQWGANTVEAPDQQRQAKYDLLDGQAFAKMYIPAFGPDYRFSIVEGTTDKDLEIGPGHYKNTALPGEPGNFSVAGHRVGKGAPFNDLDLLGSCDAIVVETQIQWFVYRVLPMSDELGGWAEKQANPKCQKVSPLGAPYDRTFGQEIVLPTQGEVIAPVPYFEGELAAAQQASLMTLTTCHPRFSDKQRLIVHAVLTDSYPKAPDFVPDAMKES
ncbi:class E sortase [Actinosynnema sp. NPDC059797]